MRLRNAPSITLSGPIERVGVGWCTDGAGYPLRLAAYMVDQGCQLVKPSRMAIVRFLAGLSDSISGAPADTGYCGSVMKRLRPRARVRSWARKAA